MEGVALMPKLKTGGLRELSRAGHIESKQGT